MPIKSKEASKFYIEQLLLDNENNPTNWTDDYYNRVICHGDKCIGYLFSTKEGIRFAPDSRVLNIYLIKPQYYKQAGIYRQELSDQWNIFVSKCISEEHHSKRNVFRNPPVEQWIDTKENWCKKLAAKISEQFDWTFSEALSEVYFTVMRCYRKGHVYMGNLGYIQTAVYNSVRMSFRDNRNKLNQDSGRAESLETPIGESDDGEQITLGDCVGVEDPLFAEMEYKEFEKELKDVLLLDFSERELEQILNQKSGYLPMNLYRRLIRWRGQHSPEEFTK